VSRNTLLGLVFQLALTAEQSWRRLGGFKLLPAVVQGMRFVDRARVTDQLPSECEEEQQIAA
jgi:putative transposase